MTRGAIAEGWRDRLAAAGLLAPEGLLHDSLERLGGRWELLSKPGLGGRERWRWRMNDDSMVFVKRYERTPWRAQLDRIFRQSPAHSRGRWEYSVSQRLAEAHIPAPSPIAFAEEMRGGLEQRSAVILNAVAGDGFDRVWRRLCEEGAPLTRGAPRRDLARRLARFVAAFHETGLCHRDLYLCHVFAELDPRAVTSPRFTLIDLARTHRPRWRRSRWLIKDLAQLDASARQVGATRTDRLRFLRSYLGLERGAPRVAYYVRSVLRKSDWILNRDERKKIR